MKKYATLTIAHRGARSVAPENTLAAADVARKMGADLWETDVNVTKDGELILFHDDTLDRTTDAVTQFPSVAELHCLESYTLSHLKTLDLGKVFVEKDPFGCISAGDLTVCENRNISEKEKRLVLNDDQPMLFGACRSINALLGEKIPTLREALNYTATHAWPVNLELKQQKTGPLKNFPLPEKVATLIRHLNIDRRLIIVSSFNHGWLDRMAEELPDVEIQALVGNDDEWRRGRIDWGTYRFDTYNVNSEMISMTEIQKLKEMGKKVNLYTVNDVDAMQRFIEAGVDGIITDFPQRLLILLKRLVSV